MVVSSCLYSSTFTENTVNGSSVFWALALWLIRATFHKAAYEKKHDPVNAVSGVGLKQG